MLGPPEAAPSNSGPVTAVQEDPSVERVPERGCTPRGGENTGRRDVAGLRAGRVAARDGEGALRSDAGLRMDAAALVSPGNPYLAAYADEVLNRFRASYADDVTWVL